jgi:hypothetical protein
MELAQKRVQMLRFGIIRIERSGSLGTVLVEACIITTVIRSHYLTVVILLPHL